MAEKDHSFEREMVIQRIRNPQDDSQYVDIAITTKLTVQTGSGPTFMRNVYNFNTYQLFSGEQSKPFPVKTADDLKAAAHDFAAAHPD
jgi:hypothetical protein